jgi:hypothetical protein
MEGETRPGRNGGRLKVSKLGDPAAAGSGRPKGSLSAKTIIKKWLEAKEKAKNPISGKEQNLTQYDIIALAQIQKARKGDTAAFNALLDRTEGKPKQEIEQTVNQRTVIIDTTGDDTIHEETSGSQEDIG